MIHRINYLGLYDKERVIFGNASYLQRLEAFINDHDQNVTMKVFKTRKQQYIGSSPVSESSQGVQPSASLTSDIAACLKSHINNKKKAASTKDSINYAFNQDTEMYQESIDCIENSFWSSTFTQFAGSIKSLQSLRKSNSQCHVDERVYQEYKNNSFDETVSILITSLKILFNSEQISWRF